MYYDEHRSPHFHVAYQGDEAVIRIDTLELMRGALPRRAFSLVVKWALAHRDELRHNRNRAERGEPILAIAPLE